MKTKYFPKLIPTICLFGLILVSLGCENMRPGITENQKANAWLHNRTAAAAARMACDEDTSPQLQGLAELSELQSRAFTAYFGAPAEYLPAETAGDILSQPSRDLAASAIADSAVRPTSWDMADAAMELGIGICAVLGGVYGAKAAKFLKDAKAKSQALKEVIAGNELFKSGNADRTEAFKQAQAGQSPQTRTLVAELKAG